MKTLIILAACASIALPAVAFCQDAAGFLVVNGTAYPIREIAVSPPDLNSWGANALGAPVLKKGEARRVKARTDGTECIQDVRATFDDDASTAVWQHLDICDLRKITLHFDRMSGISTAQYSE
jgi:hypothetical protein